MTPKLHVALNYLLHLALTFSFYISFLEEVGPLKFDDFSNYQIAFCWLLFGVACHACLCFLRTLENCKLGDENQHQRCQLTHRKEMEMCRRICCDDLRLLESRVRGEGRAGFRSSMLLHVLVQPLDVARGAPICAAARAAQPS